MNSVYDKVITNKPICNVLEKVVILKRWSLLDETTVHEWNKLLQERMLSF